VCLCCLSDNLLPRKVSSCLQNLTVVQPCCPGCLKECDRQLGARSSIDNFVFSYTRAINQAEEGKRGGRRRACSSLRMRGSAQPTAHSLVPIVPFAATKTPPRKAETGHSPLLPARADFEQQTYNDCLPHINITYAVFLSSYMA
jgi:hypothetical protein